MAMLHSSHQVPKLHFAGHSANTEQKKDPGHIHREGAGGNNGSMLTSTLEKDLSPFCPFSASHAAAAFIVPNHFFCY